MSTERLPPIPRVELGERVMAAAPVVILLLGSEGTIEYANPHFERLTGYRLAEIRGKDWFDTFLPERDRERIRALFRTSYQGERVRGNVNPILTRAGEEREIEWIDEMLYDAEGTPAWLLAVGYDVTERMAAQEALKASEHRLAEAHRIAKIGAWRVEPTGRAWWSEEQYRINGFPIGVPVTRDSFLNLIHADDRAMFARVIEDMLATGSAVAEFRIVRPDGEVRDIQGRAKVAYDPSGRPVAWAGTNQDITDRKRADRQLRASVAAQQRLVAELTEINHRKNDFIAMLSHELRNPLAAIQNGMYTLGEVPADSDQARCAMALVNRQVGQLARLVDDLLDVSRITQHKFQLKLAPVDLCQLVRTVIDDHRGEFADRGVRLESDVPVEPHIVVGDPARLTQVIGNLLHNALKFTPRGGETRVSLIRDDATSAAILGVTDTGAGIAPSMLPRLFQAFAQDDRTLARSLGGLGLGLALVKELVELHGGAVSARSEGEEQGSQFVIQLPLARPDEVRAASPSDHRGELAARRVLVIEDNVDVAESLRGALEVQGHVVVLAREGASGIEQARDFRPDVVLCDLGLPGLSGYDVARELRSNRVLATTRLVAMSGYAAPDDVEKSLATGFDEHLAKPVSPAALERALQASGGPKMRAG